MKSHINVLGLALFTCTNLFIAGSLSARGYQHAKKSIHFIMSDDASCPSGYAADDLNTETKESACLELNLDGYEASAFQDGVYLEQTEEAYQEFWPLSQLLFSTEPRELPNPAVSPIIYFTFVKNSSCPSGYSGKLIKTKYEDSACLNFNLGQYSGVGRAATHFVTTTNGSREFWHIEKPSFNSQFRSSK